MESSSEWIRVCAASDIDAEDVLRFDFAGRAYAIYHTPEGFFATSDLCTHGGAHLSDGLVIGDIIECPLHQGRFHIPTGSAKSAPACRNLRTYPVRVEQANVFISLSKTLIS